MISCFLYAWVLDFDGTAADTFEPSPNGIGVKEAYRLACEELFGSSEGAELFKAVGGLNNRSPGAFVQDVLDKGNTNVLVRRAKTYLDVHGSALVGFVPSGKGADLVWSDEHVLAVVTELVVRIKLRILTAQVGTKCTDGTPWPRPCRGFVDLWQGVESFNAVRGGRAIIVPGIISSGHDLFIEKCFRVWGLDPPKLILSDDTMRSAKYRDLPPEERRKPHPGLFKLFSREWLCACGDERDEDPLSCLAGRAFYGGDSLKDDGELARSVDLPFLWFNPHHNNPDGFTGKIVSVADWSETADQLLSEDAAHLMRQGRPFAEILDTLGL